MISSGRWSPWLRSAPWRITVIAAISNATAIAIEATVIASTVVASTARVIPGIGRSTAIARVATTSVRVTVAARAVITNVRVTVAARVVTINPGASTDRGGGM